MKTKFKVLIAAAALVVLLAAAFLLLDFRLMTSRTNSQSTVASSSGGDGAPKSVVVDTTGLYVEGPDALAASLGAEIRQGLQGEQHVGELTTINMPADKLDIAQMVVQVTPETRIWTPFYAQSEYLVSVSYASNGDVSFRNQEAPHFMFVGPQAAMQFDAEITVKDQSAGLMSAPGYRHYLAEKIAGMIKDTFQQEYNR